MLDNTIPEHSGPAFCFPSQEKALEALNRGVVKPGSVIVVRYAGPRGAPGMPDIYALLATIVGRGLEGKVAVVTDGRFSGFARGLGVCQVLPRRWWVAHWHGLKMVISLKSASPRGLSI